MNNGWISIKNKSLPCKDEFGRSIPNPNPEWSSKRRCRFRKRNDTLGKSQGSDFRYESFYITSFLKLNQDIKEGKLVPTFVRIYNDNDFLISEKEVDSFQVLPLVGKVKIITK